MSNLRSRRGGYDELSDDDGETDLPILQTSISSPKTALSKKLGMAIFLVSVICIGLITALIVVTTSHVSGDIGYAVCDFVPVFTLNSANKVGGRITLVDTADGVEFKYNITGLMKSRKQAVFLHTYAGNAQDDASRLVNSVGPVFNPGNSPHGCPTSMRRRAGDIPDVEADADGRSKSASTEHPSQLIRMEGDWGVIGRSIVIYDKADDNCGDNPQGIGMGSPYGLCQIVVRKSPSE
jgi:Cu/Zn superoxide dismutase